MIVLAPLSHTIEATQRLLTDGCIMPLQSRWLACYARFSNTVHRTFVHFGVEA